jgi:hypothetical protein
MLRNAKSGFVRFFDALWGCAASGTQGLKQLLVT